MTSPSLPNRTAAGAVAVLAVLLVAIAPGTVATAVGGAVTVPSSGLVPSVSVTIDITATSALSFAPNSFTVSPGETVNLVVTQAASFEHTFTLSSVVNYTIPSGDTPAQLAAFFNAHPPLVNLSLGSTAGSQHDATFVAPTTVGTYEFVCLIHFPSMIGVMTDSNSSSTGGGGSTGLSTTELVAIVIGVVVVAIAGVVLVVRRRRPPK